MDQKPRDFRDAVRSAAIVGAIVAALSFSRALARVARGTAPGIMLLEAPSLGFAVFFVAILMLQLTGAVRRDGFEFTVSPWFAVAAIGALVAFFVGALAHGHSLLATDAERVGLIAAA